MYAQLCSSTSEYSRRLLSILARHQQNYTKIKQIGMTQTLSIRLCNFVRSDLFMFIK